MLSYIDVVLTLFIGILSFSRSLASAVKVPGRKKRRSLNNEPYLARPTLIELRSNEISYYSFMVSVDRCDECCKALDGLSSRICVPNKTEDVNLNVFKMITRIN